MRLCSREGMHKLLPTRRGTLVVVPACNKQGVYETNFQSEPSFKRSCNAGQAPAG